MCLNQHMGKLEDVTPLRVMKLSGLDLFYLKLVWIVCLGNQELVATGPIRKSDL